MAPAECGGFSLPKFPDNFLSPPSPMTAQKAPNPCSLQIHVPSQPHVPFKPHVPSPVSYPNPLSPTNPVFPTDLVSPTNSCSLQTLCPHQIPYPLQIPCPLQTHVLSKSCSLQPRQHSPCGDSGRPRYLQPSLMLPAPI